MPLCSESPHTMRLPRRLKESLALFAESCDISLFRWKAVEPEAHVNPSKRTYVNDKLSTMTFSERVTRLINVLMRDKILNHRRMKPRDSGASAS